MTDEIPKPEVDLLPLGTIAPFPEGKVPEDWEQFDGRSLPRENHEQVWETLYRVKKAWCKWFGGDLTDAAIVLPDLDSEQSQHLMYGFSSPNHPPMVLAIKVERRTNIRDASSPASEVRSDDSPQGQPGE